MLVYSGINGKAIVSALSSREWASCFRRASPFSLEIEICCRTKRDSPVEKVEFNRL